MGSAIFVPLGLIVGLLVYIAIILTGILYQATHK